MSSNSGIPKDAVASRHSNELTDHERKQLVDLMHDQLSDAIVKCVTTWRICPDCLAALIAEIVGKTMTQISSASLVGLQRSINGAFEAMIADDAAERRKMH